MSFSDISNQIRSYCLEYVTHLEKVTIIVALVTFVLLLIKNQYKKKDNDLGKIINSVLSATSLPVAIALFMCALYPSLIKEMDGITIYFVVAGIALLIVSYVGIKSDW